MAKIKITQKDTTQNIISSLILCAIFMFFAYIMRTKELKIVFYALSMLFALYLLIWIIIFLHHKIHKLQYADPEELKEEEPEEIVEEPVLPERKVRTYSPIRDYTKEDVPEEENETGDDDNSDEEET